MSRGERVLIVTDRDGETEPALIEALRDAVAARGAEAATFACPPFDARRADLPADLAEAMAAASLVISLGEHESLVHTPAGRVLVRERGVRLVVSPLRRMADWETPFARFPLDRIFARARAAARWLGRGGEARLCARNGTDLRFTVPAGNVVGMPGGAEPAPLAPGRGGFSLFPPGALGTSPRDARGTLVLDGLVGFAGVLPEPVRLDVAGGFVTKVSGGRAAAWFEGEMKRHDNGGFLGKLIVGIHPAAPVEAGLRELDRRKARLSRGEGVTLIGFGDARAVGGQVASTWHWDGVVLPPIDLEVAGRPLFSAGTLQALPEVVSSDVIAGDLPHKPRLLVRAGELAVLGVSSRGVMHHAHRNLEGDELWIPLAGPPVGVEIEGRPAEAVAVGAAALVPRGLAHRVLGPDAPATMLVVERLGDPALPVASPAPPYRVFDLGTLETGPTPHWSQAPRPLAASASMVVEGYSRAEGMLRPEERLDAPEVWVPLRGGLRVETDLEHAPLSSEVRRGDVVSLPPGVLVRVLSVRPDTIALRVRLP